MKGLIMLVASQPVTVKHNNELTDLNHQMDANKNTNNKIHRVDVDVHLYIRTTK